LQDVAVRYRRISRDAKLAQMRAAIGVDKRPFVFGFSVYDSFESEQVAATGIVPMPGPNENLLGGHAVKAVGYNDRKRLMKCRNSWGLQWGDKGHFWLPYDFFTTSSLSSDFWVIDTVSIAA
jgi:C1A family cysteine protease